MMCLDYWKDIKSYEDKYAVSYWGNVRSLGWYVRSWPKGKRFKKSRILRPCLNKYGYLHLNICANNKRTIKTVHRLVAEAFIPNSNNYPQINHKNGTKTDNRVENLEWCSASENSKHAFKNGLRSNKGEKHPRAKLTERQVKEIRSKLFVGLKGVDLAKEYGVNPETIRMIKVGRSWSHVCI